MSDNEAPSRYGNYEVLARPDGTPELLGNGAFGQTYKARHAFLGQIVALKVISEKFVHDANAKERFLREARVVHGLHHPHIAQVVDFGEAHGTLYYAMEFCAGGSLEDLVRRVGPVDPATVGTLARQLAEALECSHRNGFLHRDIKPANVMLAGGDALVLKLVDFGLVKPLAQDSERMASLTLDGQTFFTPLFASPEQVMEEELDARSDLFSMGMTLWFLLKGTSPEAGSTAVVMAKRLSVDSYKEQVPATVPPVLRSVLQKLLEKDKTKRFGSAAAVLTSLASDQPVPEPLNIPVPVEDGDSSVTLAFESPARPAIRLADKYRIVEKAGRSTLGNLYRATRAGDGVPLFVTVLDDALRENVARMERLRTAVTQAARCTHESLCQVYGLEKFADAEVLVREWNGGVSLQSVVRGRGSIPFAEAIVPLRMIAAGVDHAASAGLGGVRLTPDEIALQPADGSQEFAGAAALPAANLRQWPPFRLRLTPILLEDEVAQDVSMTLSAEAIGSPRVEFGSLLYRLVAGMQVKFAARVNRGSYVRTGALSEEGNRILSGCIADEPGAPADCRSLLTALQRAEGVGGGETRLASVARLPGATTRAPAKTGGNVPARSVQPPEFSAAPPAPPAFPPVPPPLPAGGVGTAPAAPARSSPLVPILIGLTVAGVVLVVVAFVLVRNRPSPTERERNTRQSVTPAPTVEAAPPAPSQTAAARTPADDLTPPVATTFVLRDGVRLSASTRYELGGQPATPTRRGGDLVFTLDPAAGPSTDLVVKTPGFLPMRLSVGAGNSAALPDPLEREVLPVFLVFRSKETDYSYVAFSYSAPLSDENVRPPGDLIYSLQNITSPAKLQLPTGKYTYTLSGANQAQDTRVLPFKGAVTVSDSGRIEVAVPPSFAGSFRGEFDDDRSHARVTRTITLRPGLAEGRCDEQTPSGGNASESFPLAEIRLDGEGVLRAHIRYAASRNPATRTYDELFELRHDASGNVVMTGGRQMMPSDPVMRSELERKPKEQPPSQSNRPGETILRPVE